MKTKQSYYLILVVYTSLWACQMVASHMTHSLIILTDSYINLYKILDISLGLLHLKTQTQSRKSRKEGQLSGNIHSDNLAGRVFNRLCTYQFKRLPVLGSFVNRLFLAALLMSAAIEGIQTCFHASHSTNEDFHLSIFERNRYAYPSILVAFAVVGIVMQWCSSLTHRMREEELESESLIDISDDDPKSVHVLDAGLLGDTKQVPYTRDQQVALDGDVKKTSLNDLNPTVSPVRDTNENVSKKRYSFDSKRHRSFDSIPLESDDKNQIFLTSLKSRTSLDGPIRSVSTNLNLQNRSSVRLAGLKRDKWIFVRYFTSPFALISCALIVYFINDDLIKEIADGILAVLVVALLFTASYPPMKEASKVLLQSAPDDVDVDSLRSSILGVSHRIVNVKELAVWSLTSKSNRVATCHITLDAKQAITENQLAVLLRDVRLQLLKQNIKCSAVQPIFTEDTSLE